MPEDNISGRGRRPSERSEGQETYLGPNSRLEGKLIVEGDLVVHGRVTGELHSAGLIRVESGAKVEASLGADRVTLRGDVTGTVIAAGGLALEGSGSLNGDVQVGALIVEEGALLNGRVTMQRRGVGAERTSAKATASDGAEAAGGAAPADQAVEKVEREKAGARG
ncbi:MAG: polymer-forming cytoskeletal protein [Candidatus Dormibacteraeota bacterium]|uniref:Polymer-forming cytoskeletal protein n=1 Tax=Candidatus Dormiibacter inghamiae TaxID=3127013 RepID=A0A934NCP4_9BACT|nr:polymer-forming cytoskeletal protein [Candidatus Dormibacteraeota bacterium]MBJ7605527.1 polymer-forming cytoskeletal protein [Candidatus Dormibacteraeota bacterium]